ncbi:unnamed protein product, partial [Mesorhabditis belari]|uniref:Chitin-binding type-2 domain-containing protein n=1 Tax=Mesorhabditis belari TaxID=2138241 RepID=A0AAF3E9G5_9BILA
MRHGPWVHLIPVLIYTALGDVIFTREICSPETFGGLQPIQGNPHKYRQCSGSGVVWIVPCQPGTLFDPVDRVCRIDTPGRGIPFQGKKYRPKPNSAIGGTQRPATETTDAEEFLFTTRKPRPIKGNRIKGGQRIRTTTRAPATPNLRPRQRTTISPRHQTISIAEYSTIRPKPAFTPPQPRIRSTTPPPLLATQKSMSTTRRPWTTGTRRPWTTGTRRPWTTETRRPVFSQTTTIDYKTAEEIEMSIDISDEAIPTVGYRKTTTGSPPAIRNSIEEDYPEDEDEATTTEISIITTPTSLWVQPSTEHPSTVFKPLPPSVHPRLPPETPIRPLSQGKLGPLNSRVTSPRQPPPFAPPGPRPAPIPVPRTVVIEKPRTTTSVENLNSLEVISGEVIPTTTQFPTLLTYPPYIYEKGQQRIGDIKAGELDEKSIETTRGLSITDRQFLKELMEMVRSQKTAEEAAQRIEKERQRQIFEKMALGRPIIVPPRNSAETANPQTYGWTHLPEDEEIEAATPAGHIQITKSVEEPYTKVHPYPDNVPAPLRPIYPGFSTPDIIRFTTQPPIDIIRFTPSPINIDNNGKEEKWVTSSLSWKPPPDFEKETETATTLTLLTGCVIGTSCPLLGDSELLCEHPSRPSLYLQCVPTSFQGGIWTERACPDTLVFIGDRCDKPDIRESLLAAGQPVIAISEPPLHSGTPIPTQQPPPITTTQPSIVLTTMNVPYIENNEMGKGDYLQWQRIGVPTVRQPPPKQPQIPKLPLSTLIKENSFGNRENEMIDYSQVFPLFPMVQPSFLSPRNLNALQLRRRPTYYYGGRQPALLRPIYDAPYQHGNSTINDQKTKENEKTVKEDFIVDKVVKPALRKIAFDTSKGLVDMLMVKPVHQMDTFLAKRIEEMKSREMNGTETQGSTCLKGEFDSVGSTFRFVWSVFLMIQDQKPL